MKHSSVCFLLLLITLLTHAAAPARDFNRNFSDSTLRLDYVFGGMKGDVSALLQGMSKQAGWAGRRGNLRQTPSVGNGTVLVADAATGDTLYSNSFSSLFHEWVCTDAASETPAAFQNSFLVPLPKREALIHIELRNNRREVIAKATNRFSPTDELVALRGQRPSPHTYIHHGGSPADAIDVAVVAEGYTESEMYKFRTDARKFVDEILAYEPFASNKDKFNFLAVEVPSAESGVSVPLAADWKQTALGSHFSTFHSERYLTVPEVWRLHNILEGIPYEHILVVANTSRYGGGGIFNCYQIATADNEYTLPVTVHEFGHSFGALADEYFYPEYDDHTYPLDIEPWEANITTLVDFPSKWMDMVDSSVEIPTPWEEEVLTRDEQRLREAKRMKVPEGPVGAYEGGGYKVNGIYRPQPTCRMRDNHYPSFCPVCERELRRLIDFYTAP